MGRIILIGVNHGYEFLPTPGVDPRVEDYGHAREPFTDTLRRTIQSEGVTRVFEEDGSGYSASAGIANGVRTPAIPSTLGLPHTPVDATAGELRAAGLSAVPGEARWEEDRPARDRVREDKIAERVTASLGAAETAIVVVGSDHLEGLRARFEASGIKVTVHDTTQEEWAQPLSDSDLNRTLFPDARLDEEDS
jgi:hypothetical protein